MYTWGHGERGILGHGEEDEEKQPRVLEAMLGRSVRMVALGKQHSIALGGVWLTNRVFDIEETLLVIT